MLGKTETAQPSEIPEPRRPTGCIFLLLLALLISAMALTIVIYEILCLDRIYPGVSVVDVDVGGLTPQEAEVMLQETFARYQEERLSLRYGQGVWEASPRELGASFDARGTAAAAYSVGREDSLPGDLRRQVEVLWHGYNVLPILDFNEGVCALFLSQLGQEIDRPVQNATLEIYNFEVHETPGQIGQRLDVAATMELLQQGMVTLSNEGIDLVVEETQPMLTDVSAARNQLERMIGAPLTLTFTDRAWVYGGSLELRSVERAWTLDRAAIADMIVLHQEEEGGQAKLVPGLDQDKLTAYVEGIARQIDQSPREARFEFDAESGRLAPIITSQEGRALDMARTVELINAQITTENRTIPLPVAIEKPKVAMEDAGGFGIVELVSKGVSYFKGSSWGRSRNIQAAAARFHGVVVPPGEVFSFNAYLGDVVDATGYEDSLIIFGDRTVLGTGGGVCQVSTTAFRAAFWGGFPIVERWAHAYRVSWYEPPVGLDATVFSPLVDFKFQNDTPHHILIQTEVDTENGVLTFYFYGTNPGRAVEMEGPYTANPVPAGPPIYEEDPTLPKGTIKQVEWEHDGLDVTIYRLVKRGDEVISRDRFFSHYEPWQARYLVGTKE